ncbi:hypothetical protein H0H87_002761, partial [Tephrocybe sp. NHM501043]
QAHAPYPAPRSHTPATPPEEDIGSSDSSSNSSDYSSEAHGSDELEEDEQKPLVDGRGDSASASGKGGFTFSAATWSSANPNPNAAPPPRPHHAQNPYPSDRPERRPRSHYDHPPRYYTQPPLHPPRLLLPHLVLPPSPR